MTAKNDFDEFMNLIKNAELEGDPNNPHIINKPMNDDITNSLSFKMKAFFDSDGMLSKDAQRHFEQYFKNNTEIKVQQKLVVVFNKAYENIDLGINEKLSEFMKKIHETPEATDKRKRIYGRPADTMFADHKGMQKLNKKKANKENKKEGVLKKISNVFKKN